MTRFLLFIKRVYFFLIFIVLEFFAVKYYLDNSAYSNSVSLSAVLTNGTINLVQDKIYKAKMFFFLGQENRALNEEISSLRDQLVNHKFDTLPFSENWILSDSVNKFNFKAVKVVNNSYVKSNNFITIDQGIKDGVKPNMSLIANGAIVGYVVDCSDNYAVAISVLNMRFRTSGQDILGTYSGSVSWDGLNINEVVMSEIPKYANINIGDTIVTTSYSARFPKNINIGIVKSVELINATYHEARLTLCNNFTMLNYLQLVDNIEYEEQNELEESVKQKFDN